MPLVRVSNGGASFLPANTYWTYKWVQSGSVSSWTMATYTDGVQFGQASQHCLCMLVGVHGKSKMTCNAAFIIGLKADGTQHVFNSGSSLVAFTDVDISEYEVLVYVRPANGGTGTQTITIS